MPAGYFDKSGYGQIEIKLDMDPCISARYHISISKVSISHFMKCPADENKANAAPWPNKSWQDHNEKNLLSHILYVVTYCS